MNHAPLQDVDDVRLFRYQTNACFHLNVGKVSIHLTPCELMMTGAVIDRWWRQHPEEFNRLLANAEE